MSEPELLGLEKGTARLGVDQLCRLIGELGNELPALAVESRRDRNDAPEPADSGGADARWPERPVKGEWP